MGNKIFKAILDEHISVFKNSFSKTSKDIFYNEETQRLIHPGEYGMYREDIVKDFLRIFTPENLVIDDGFVITNDDIVSTQCDVIIYDKSATPVVKNKNKQKFFTVETVAGIGEIKSTLSKKDFAIALKKLANNKSIRKPLDKMKDGGFTTSIKHHELADIYDDTDPLNHIFSFLICKKLDFNLENIYEEMDAIYKDIPYKYRHNLILSLDDGLLTYSRNSIGFPYPSTGYETNANKYIPNTTEDSEIKLFGHFLFYALINATIFQPDIILYLRN